MRRVPVLIVGGGPAGTAAAIALGRGGVRAELIERSTGAHDVVCGGFCGWDALAALKRLGIDTATLGAPPITRLRLVGAGRIVEAELPRPAAGLSRRSLDEAMLAAAIEAGATVRRGVTVRSADEAQHVRLDTGEEIGADALFLATGKRDLRGVARPMPSGQSEGAVGLRTSVATTPALARQLAGTIELHLFDGGYAGLLIQEGGRVNLCLSVSAARLRAAGGIDPLLRDLTEEAPMLGDSLALAVGSAWITVSNVPYGWRALAGTPHLYRLGDQASVIASLAGDGIAIALTSGLAAARAHLRGETAPTYQRRWASRAGRPLRVAEALRTAGEAPRSRRVLLSLARVPGLAGMAARLTRIG